MSGNNPQRRQLDYLDFELEIGLGSGREYPVAVLDSPAGEARATLHFPLDDLALENRLLALQNALLRSGGQQHRTLSPQQQAVQDFGRELFEALFPTNVRGCYMVSLREAAQQRKGLRLKLRIHPPKLAALPWEYLWHPDRAEYLSLSTHTPIVRYVELPQPIQPLAVTLPLRILGMIASPSDLPPLHPEREKQRMERALGDLSSRGMVELTWLGGQSWRDLMNAMREYTWHVFHFIGHGGFDRNSGEGLIVLTDREGKAAHFSATRLGRLLADHDALRLVLLNSCEGARGSERDIFSSTASVLVRRGIPAVLAMQYEITDQAAIEFSRTFYEAVADGLPVDGAVAESRKAISFAVNNTVEWGTPVLYMRSPDGALFQVTERPPEASSSAEGPEPPPPVDAERERQLEQLYLDGLDAFWVEEWDEAARCFRAVVDQRPEYRDAAARLREAERQGELARLYAQAQAAQEAGDWTAARIALEKLVAGAAEYRDAAALLDVAKKQARLADLYAQAQQLHRAGRWQAVVNVFAQIAALAPDHPDPEGLLAAAQQEMEAEQRRAEARDLYGRAGRAVDAGQWAEARRLLRQVQEQQPGHRETERLLARAEAEIERQKLAAPPRVAPAKGDRLLAARPKRVSLPAWFWPAAGGAAVLLVIVVIIIAALGGGEGRKGTPTYTPRPAGTETKAPEPTEEAVPTAAQPLAVADAGDTWTRSADGMVMVYVPAGEFLMGSADVDSAAEDDEKPQHTVILDAFWIDKTEVTNAQYRECVQAGACIAPSRTETNSRDSYYDNSSFDDYPVIYVDWSQAKAYCEWAGARLPTEAEWEKAARGTDGRKYPWGNQDPDCNRANYGGMDGCVGDTSQVGSYSTGASPYGALNMAGNVWEWVADWYDSDYYADSPERYPQGPDLGSQRALRGGSWNGIERVVRVADRRYLGPSDSYNSVGFRCARSGSEPMFTSTPSLAETPPIATDIPQPTATLVPTVTSTLRAPQAGEPQTRSKDGMVMVYVPAGEFTMGSSDADIDAILAECSDCERDWFTNEQPQHTVTLDAFWIDRTEVTNAQYARFLNALGGHQGECGGQDCIDTKSEDDSSHILQQGGQYMVESGYEDHPMIEVSWYGAQAYCEWAGARLPTEAEWEKAARGTDGRRYPWGDSIPDCNKAQYGECHGRTVPVGSKPAGASPYGALDMAGNVWEWVADWSDMDYYDISPSNNPKGPNSGGIKMLRGGGWGASWDNCHAAYRTFGGGPMACNFSVGFRCVGVGSPGE